MEMLRERADLGKGFTRRLGGHGDPMVLGGTGSCPSVTLLLKPARTGRSPSLQEAEATKLPEQARSQVQLENEGSRALSTSVILSGGERAGCFSQRLAEPESKALRGFPVACVTSGASLRGRPAGAALRREGAFRCGRSLVRGARSFDSLGRTLSFKGTFFASLAQDDGAFFFNFARF